jgi:hypothetical protein
MPGNRELMRQQLLNRQVVRLGADLLAGSDIFTTANAWPCTDRYRKTGRLIRLSLSQYRDSQ